MKSTPATSSLNAVASGLKAAQTSRTSACPCPLTPLPGAYSVLLWWPCVTGGGNMAKKEGKEGGRSQKRGKEKDTVIVKVLVIIIVVVIVRFVVIYL